MDWRAHIARYGQAIIPGEPWARRALLAILLLGAVLRFWDLPHLPYTHDELSALTRLHPTLKETITDGVIANDTHPPGVQVFEWLWTRVFSVQEADVKLPFIVMGLAAIVLLYRFALAWTGTGAALMLATLMATLQYSVFYGQLARPYAAGLFTTALLADQLTRWLAFHRPRMLVGAAIAMVLSAYTHHFSLLLAAIMAVSTLLLARPAERRGWLLACAAAALAYLPNIPIFLSQLGQGGLQGWLRPPSPGWLADYGAYIAHWSPFLGGALLLVIGGSAFLAARHGALPSTAVWLLAAWGALPLIVGYAYSVWRAPVLQYSMLLFSFPYIALLLLQGLRHLRPAPAMAACALLAAVAVHSLVHVRKHHLVTYHSKYEAILREAITATKAMGRERLLVLVDAPWHMIDFYKRHWGVPEGELNEVNILGMEQARVDSILAAHSGDAVLLGRSNGADDEHPALVQQRFPRLAHRTDLAEGQVLLFSKAPVAFERFDRDTLAAADGKGTVGPWQIAGHLPHDAMGWSMQGAEFGLLMEIALDTVVRREDDLVELVLEVDGHGPLADAGLVAELRSTDSTVFYRTGELRPALRKEGVSSLVVAVSPSYVPGTTGLLLRAYPHNRDKGPLRVRSFRVMRRAANPLRDAVLGPLPWPGRYPPE